MPVVVDFLRSMELSMGRVCPYDVTISSPKAGKGRLRTLTTRDVFFKGEVVVRATHERIVFTKPTLGYLGKANKATPNKTSGRIIVTFSGEEIPVGYYNFCKKESNEDQRVIKLIQE